MAVDVAPSGFLSEESKSRFTIAAIVLGTASFLLQFFLPFAVMMFLLPGFLSTSREFTDGESAAWWDGRLWYTSRSVQFRPSGSGSATLFSLGPERTAKPERRATLPCDTARLLPGRDRLWIFSPQGISFFKEGRLNPPVAPLPEKAYSFSPLFFHRDRPAAIAEDEKGLFLLALGDEGWVREAEVKPGREARWTAGSFQIVPWRDQLHVFWSPAETVLHRVGLPLTGEDDWAPVAPVRGTWSAVAFEKGPAIFHVNVPKSGFGATLRGTRLEAEAWTPILSHGLKLGLSASVYATGPDSFVALAPGFPEGLRVLDFEGGRLVGERAIGKPFPFPTEPQPMLLIFVLPHVVTFAATIAAALVLSALMRRHRVAEFEAEGRRVPFATLARRAAARLVDSALSSGPWAAVSVYLLLTFDAADFPWGLFRKSWLMGAAMGWTALLFFAFSATEGRWGWTPGKLLAGIRVAGLDLRPCGIGRALVRNALLAADGFLNFLVGIMAVAFTRRWQRVGDLAARTVVLRFPPKA